jgi:hypothetical protein
VSEPFKGFQFCEVLDGLLAERTRLTAIKVLANYGGTVNWFHGFLANRALVQNMRLIKNHECVLCEYAFRNPNLSTSTMAYHLLEEEISHLQIGVQAYLKHDIDEGGLLH